MAINAAGAFFCALDSGRPGFRATSKNSVNSEHFLGGGGGHRSDSSDTEEPVHFTSVVTSSATKHSGSYLARQEFGVGEVAGGGPGPGPDSGYVSHGSGGGYPKLLMQPVSSGTQSRDWLVT